MATLEELAQQGDPGTLASEDQASRIKLKTPQELYELWERQQWLSQDIDFEQDKRDWAGLDDERRDHFLWNLSSFFIGEERVTTQFSGLVMAYDDEQEEAFLTSQQVDEARHMQFFDRFYREVIGYDDPDVSRRLERTREHLNDAFGKLFDESLVQAGEALIRDPARSRREDRLRDHLPHGHRGRARADRAALHHRVHGEGGPAPGVRRGLRQRGARRAPPRRVRHLVPRRTQPPATRPRRAGSRRSSRS